MRNWVWTSPSSESFLKPGVRSGTPGFAVPAMHPASLYPPCTRRSVPAVMCPRIRLGRSGTQIGCRGGLEVPSTGYNEKRCLVRPARA